MSISDFTLTSPRKSALKNRSITYDEEFEKFLNDTSESDVSMTKYTKQSNEKPWWLKDDEDEEDPRKSRTDTKKSFIKQQKPPPQSSSPTKLYASQIKLTTTVEDDDEIKEAKLNEKPKEVVDLPKLSIDRSSYSMNNFEENTTKQSKSLSDNQNDDEEEDHEDDHDHKNNYDEDDEQLNETSTDNALSSPESKPSIIDRFKPSITPRLNEAKNVTPQEEKETENYSTELKALATTNLLSKVMFMDTLNETKLNATQRQVQISDTIKTINPNNTDSQTRRDLDDLERVYRNLTTFTDSGLNTLIRTNQPSADQSLEPPKRSYDHARDINKTSSINSSDIGLQAVHAITSELENRALEEILKEIERNSKFKKSLHFETSVKSSAGRESGWPPDKYSHIKSTGYGTTWSPSTYIGHLSSTNRSIQENFATTKKSPSRETQQVRQSRPKTQPKSALKQATQIIEVGRSPSAHSVESKLLKDNEIYIQSLKNLMVKRETDHENLVLELRAEIENLKSQINVKIDQSSEFTNERDKKEVAKLDKNDLEKLKEQEKLIKGYQQENERLYSDLKRLREKNKLEVQNLNEQISNLKFELIQEKIRVDNQTKSEEKSKLANAPILTNLSSITNDSVHLENELNQAKDLNKKYEENLAKLNVKLDYFEKNQHQIELDMKVIEAKSDEIKRLGNKLKQLEMGKTPPDCLKQIKMLKSQIREMDGLIKRLKQPSATSASEVNISINYYELKIKELEEQLKEKELSMARLNRFWEQKFYLYEQLKKRNLSKSPTRDVVDKKLTEFEQNYVNKIENLENLTKNLRKIISEFELRLAEKEKEISKICSEKDAKIEELNRQLQELNRPRVYEPKEFARPREESPARKSTNFDIVNENESLKLKLQNAVNEARISNREFELEIKQLKHLYETKLNETTKKHKQDIEKLLQVFTGSTISSDYMSDEFPFSDPIQMRLLLNAQKRHSEMKQTIEKQKLLLNKLNQHINEQNVYKEKYLSLEDENRRLREEIGDMKLEESFLKSISNNDAQAQLKHYEILKEKIKRLEMNLYKREKELNSVISRDDMSDEGPTSLKLNELKRFYENQLEIKNKEINKFRLEFDSMIQLLHSL